MTLPNERYRAVKYAREFLRSLLDRSKTPRVPKEIREQAYSVLRHFPGEVDMHQTAKKVKDIFRDDEES